ncbi:MAG: sensor histidine kinase [Leptospiraceae bacterium]|nr:sensor histidine kinase [Leptospiraceae bacterium]
MRVLFLILSFFIFSLSAQEEITLTPEESYKSALGKQVYFYIDKTHILTIDDISKKEFEGNFLLSTKENPQFGYTQDTIWLRFTLKDKSQIERDWLLEIAYSGLDLIEFYTNKNNVWEKKVYGDLLPFSARDFDYRNYLIRLDLPREVSRTYFLKIKTNTSFVVPLSLYESQTILKKKFLVESLYFFFYGVLVVMIFYNGFIFITFRSPSYFYYSFSTFFLLLFYLVHLGHGFQFFWSNNTFIQNYMAPISISISWIFVMEFTFHFLDLHKISNRLYRIIRLLQIVSILLLPALFYSQILVNKIIALLGILNSLLIFIAAFTSLKRGHKAARFFLFGWGILLVGVILLTLKSIGILPTNIITANAMQIGSMVELVFLSLALAEKYRFIQEENNQIQSELLKNQIKHSETLEERVKERTRELNNSLDSVRRANSQLNEYAENLKILNATKDKFFSIIAHDLRNPFIGIIGLLDSLLKNVENPENNSRERNITRIKMAKNSSKAAYTLLENLLQWAKSQKGEMHFNPKNLNLHQLIEKTIPVVKANALKKNITIEENLVGDEVVFADETLVDIILRNLISNAIKFTYPNGKITISTAKSREYLSISIKDNGMGISADNIDKLFRIESKFTRLGTEDEKGSGLGLILCKEFVELQEGEIWVESEFGKGSAFTFTLPLSR